MQLQLIVTLLAAGLVAGAPLKQLNLQPQSSGSTLSRPLRHQSRKSSSHVSKRGEFAEGVADQYMSEDEDTYDFSEQESDYLDSQSFELYDESELEEILDSNEVLDLPFDPENISEDDFEEILEIEREVWRIQSAFEENECTEEDECTDDTTEGETRKKEDITPAEVVGVAGKFWELLKIFTQEYKNYEKASRESTNEAQAAVEGSVNEPSEESADNVRE